MLPTELPLSTIPTPAFPSEIRQNSGEKLVTDSKDQAESTFVDPALLEVFNDQKIFSDGKLRLENIAIPEQPILQADAIQHLQNFMTTPFLVQGIITDKIRIKIQDALKNRKHEPAVQFLFTMEFWDKKILQTHILPGQVFLSLLDLYKGNVVKLIGGEARRALRDTFKKMVETITEKPCNLLPKKECEFATPCPDWDFVVPAENAPYEQLKLLSEVIPNQVVIQIFGQTHPSLAELLGFVVREVMFKMPEMFNAQYFTGISFGNPKQKIDITFLPKQEHNFMFEFNKVGLKIYREALHSWSKNHNRNLLLANHFVALDASRCGADKGYQAGFDYIYDILRSTNYRDVNEKGFARLILWLSKGLTCNNYDILLHFHNKLLASNKLGFEIGKHLKQAHESHNMGNTRALMASFLNTAISLTLIHNEQSEPFITEIKDQLKPLLVNSSDGEKSTLFALLLDAFKSPHFDTKYFIDFLKLCAFLAKSPQKPFFGKTALQLNDEFSLLLPLDDFSAFEKILKNYTSDRANLLKQIFDRSVGIKTPHSSSLERFSAEEKNKLKDLSIQFLEHSDRTLQRIGLRLVLLFLKNDHSLYVKLLLSLVDILLEEDSDFSHRVLGFMLRCSEGNPKDEIYALALSELSSILKKSVIPATVNRSWMYALLRTKHPDFIKAAINLWDSLSLAEKNKEAQHYVPAMLNVNPLDALSLYVKYDQTSDMDTLNKLVVKLKSLSVDFISYGLTLEKAISKTLDAPEHSNGKNRKKRSPFVNEYFWFFFHLVKLAPERASSLMQKLHHAGCLDLHEEKSAQAIVQLSQHLSCSQFLDVWTLALSYGCPLLELHSKEKNTCLVWLCEGLSAAKHPQLESILTLATHENLSQEQTERVQKIIMEISIRDTSLRAYLTKDQAADLAIARIKTLISERLYLDAAKEIEKIWDTASPERQLVLLEVELLVTAKLLKDLEEFPDSEKQKQLNALQPFLDKKLRLISKAKSSQVSKELAEAWSKFFICFYQRLVAHCNVAPKTRVNPLVQPLVAFLIDKDSYSLACELLKVLALNKMEFEPTPSLIRLLGVLVEKCPEIEKVEQVLTLLKFYQNKEASYPEQHRMYVTLVTRLFAANFNRADTWIERTLNHSSIVLPLEGKTVNAWMDRLFDQGNTWVIPKLYDQVQRIKFTNEEESAEFYLKGIRRSECPYLRSKLITNHLPILSQRMKFGEVQDFVSKILQDWIDQMFPSVTEDMIFCLKLFAMPIPHIWHRAFQILSQSNYEHKDECWLLYEVSIARGAYEEKPAFQAATCVEALKCMVAANNSQFFKSCIQGIDSFLPHVAHGIAEEAEQALFIIYRENLKTIALKKDPIQDTLFAQQLLSIRSYLKQIKPFEKIDRLILAELSKLGDRGILKIVLAFVKKQFVDKAEFNDVIQFVVNSLPPDHPDCWSTLCFYLLDYLHLVDVFPLLKIGLNSKHQGYHLTSGILLPVAMNKNPRDAQERLTVSCLVMKISEILSKENKVLREILAHPNMHNWLSAANIAACWERVIADQMHHDSLTTSPLTTNSLNLYRDNFLSIKQVNRTRCLTAGVNILIRLLVEGADDLPRFHREMISFMKTITDYQGSVPTAIPRDPQNIPRPSTKRKVICQSKEQMVQALQNLQQGKSALEVKRKGEFPTYSFPTSDCFLEFVIDRTMGRDQIHAPEFIMREGLNNIPNLSPELSSRFTVEQVEIIDSQTTLETEKLRPLETLEFLFTEKAQKDFYVQSIFELIKSLCNIKTANLEIRKTVILFCAQHILFLIENYSEYKESIYHIIDLFVFSATAVDFQYGQCRTERGKEKLDQEIFNYHNDWCHEILTTLQIKFSMQVTKYPTLFYESMLVIYPLEVYPGELSCQEQAEVIFRVIVKLIKTSSSVHFARALEIIRVHQNVILTSPEVLQYCYYELLIPNVMKDPNYLIHEKNLIFFGPENARQECIYMAKRPLYMLLNDCVRKLFEKKESSSNTANAANAAAKIDLAKAVVTLHFKTMFEVLENHDNSNFDILYDIVFGMNVLAERGCFIDNHVSFRDFVQRAKPHLLKKLQSAKDKKETLQYINLPYLFITYFPFPQKAQREHWLGIFNSLIKDLLDIKDEEMNKFVIDLVKTSFISKGFFNGCKAQLTAIKKIIG